MEIIPGNISIPRKQSHLKKYARHANQNKIFFAGPFLFCYLGLSRCAKPGYSTWNKVLFLIFALVYACLNALGVLIVDGFNFSLMS